MRFLFVLGVRGGGGRSGKFEGTNANGVWGDRNGMVNISPVGRNASTKERNEYEKYDKEHHIREKMVEALKAEFPDFGLT